MEITKLTKSVCILVCSKFGFLKRYIHAQSILSPVRLTLCDICLVLVGSRNRLYRNFTIQLKCIEDLLEDLLKCQISTLVKYRQNQTKYRYTCFIENIVCMKLYIPAARTYMTPHFQNVQVTISTVQQYVL